MADRPSNRPAARIDGIRVLLGANLLLTGVLAWTQLADRPIAASSATATAAQPNFPNASSQRLAIEKAVKDLKKSVDGLAQSIERGKLRVEVANVDEIADAIGGDGG